MPFRSFSRTAVSAFSWYGRKYTETSPALIGSIYFCGDLRHLPAEALYWNGRKTRYRDNSADFVPVLPFGHNARRAPV